jgi:predicted nucleotidyltransferase component of viral defense system
VHVRDANFRDRSTGTLVGMSLDEIRRLSLVAMVSDDALMDTLVLKGGSALALVHNVGERSSLDLDFSIASEFPDLEDTRQRMFRNLHRTFAEAGMKVFDEQFLLKPSVPSPHRPAGWGGYYLEFKLADQRTFDTFKSDLDALRRNAAVVGPSQRRKYTIDISKNEYTAGKVKRVVDDYTVYVYSLEMIVIEKLRAICQQLPAYEITSVTKRPRARDFYDIYQVCQLEHVHVGSATNRTLFVEVFRAKGVRRALLASVRDAHGYHAPDWPSVELSISGPHEEFRFYFDFVVRLIEELKPLWVE